MTTTQEQHLRKVHLALTSLHRFRWLRSAELGRLVYPGIVGSRQRADALMRAMIKRGLVINRKLPEGAGRCFLLSEAGARQLRDCGIEDAKTGKDYGEIDSGSWRPTLDWKHDLIAAGVLTLLAERGYDIKTESEIRRAKPDLFKIPDGLALIDGRVYWLEVERAKKTGKAGDALGQALAKVAEHGFEVLPGWVARHPMVAFNPAEVSADGYPLNHRANVTRVLTLALRQPARVLWVECEMQGNGVTGIRALDGLVESDKAAAVLKILNARGWRELEPGESNVLSNSYSGHELLLWLDEDVGCWVAEIDGICGEFFDTETEAKYDVCKRLLAANK